MKLYITDTFIKVETASDKIYRIPTGQVTNVSTLKIGADYRYTLSGKDDDTNDSFSFLHSEITKYYVDGSEVTPISEFAVLIAKIEAVVGVGATITGVSGFSTEATLASVVKAEDAAHSSGDKGIMMLGVRNDLGAVMAGTTGDYIPFQMNENGLLGINLDAIRDVAPDMGTGAPSGSCIRVTVAGAEETPAMAVHSDSQTIGAGYKTVTIITNATFEGTILTAVATASTTYPFAASSNNTLGAIAVTRTAGSYTVITSGISA